MIIFQNMLKRIFNKKVNIIFMLVIPIMMNILVIMLFSGEVTYSVGIIDNDNTEFTESIISYLDDNLKVTMLTDKDDYRYKIINDGMKCVFYFEEGFTENLLAQKNITIDSYSLESSNYANPIQLGVASYIYAAKEIAIQVNGNEIEFYQKIKEFNTDDLSVEYLYSNENNNSTKELSNSSLGYMAFCMIFLMIFTTANILEDRLSGVLNRLNASSVKYFSYYFQHLLSYFLIMFLQIVIVIIIIPFVTEISYGNTWLDVIKVIVICSIFSMVCIAIGMVINKFCKTRMMSGVISTLVNFPLLFLGGCFVPMHYMPELIQKVGCFVPTAWYMSAVSIVLDGGTLYDARQYIGLMLGFVMILLIVLFAKKVKEE